MHPSATNSPNIEAGFRGATQSPLSTSPKRAAKLCAHARGVHRPFAQRNSAASLRFSRRISRNLAIWMALSQCRTLAAQSLDRYITSPGLLFFAVCASAPFWIPVRAPRVNWLLGVDSRSGFSARGEWCNGCFMLSRENGRARGLVFENASVIEKYSCRVCLRNMGRKKGGIFIEKDCVGILRNLGNLCRILCVSLYVHKRY